MKYSEFEKAVEEFGWQLRKYENAVYVDNDSTAIARISEGKRYMFSMEFTQTELLSDDERYDLLMLCKRLSSTPINEREDEKKYNLKFSVFTHVPDKYISKGLITGNYQITPLGYPYQKHDFTKKEIESFPDKVREYAHICEWEEVE